MTVFGNCFTISRNSFEVFLKPFCYLWSGNGGWLEKTRPSEVRPCEARPCEARPREARPCEARPCEAKQCEVRPDETLSA